MRGKRLITARAGTPFVDGLIKAGIIPAECTEVTITMKAWSGSRMLSWQMIGWTQKWPKRSKNALSKASRTRINRRPCRKRWRG